ncbi:serine hydrolase domain-containing protein [[Mycobacterium] wendilense]|uniref:Serine hydrolase domain-containing protein n=1 Tax=[Mycobacterium] wendilense TaxID=3064284 RepID=A0ABN9P1Y7_9MYCO|nr:serine hydrolase domain-containing protein [Mycolicibacterium sp. MU0050]CAJ1585244.1 serine hydrolase domain-containing protein [Mycolicibacterium sp. MU0050]
MVLKVTVAPDLIDGDVDEGYGKVADAFRANFAAGREVGAALVVYRDGAKVVDLWGGYRDGVTKARWQPDTMVNTFSTTKGVAALVVAHAVSAGLFDYDAPVCEYWPEFGAGGKNRVTVRQLLGHQAGVCALKPAPTLAEVGDPARLAPMLAAQRPAWRPGARHGYHAVTLGWYQSELIRRTDPGGRTLGRYLADEIAVPMDLDYHIGLPASVDRDRVAFIHGWPRVEALLNARSLPLGTTLSSLNPFGLFARAGAVPRSVNAFTSDYNRDDVRSVEIPSVNGIGTARAVAELYSEASRTGARIGICPKTLSALQDPAELPAGGARDKVLGVPTAYSLGFSKPTRDFCFGSSGTAFGTPGLGGSFGFADPDTGVGYGYVMNRLGFHLHSDPRELSIRQALFGGVLGVRPQR